MVKIYDALSNMENGSIRQLCLNFMSNATTSGETISSTKPAVMLLKCMLLISRFTTNQIMDFNDI